MSAVLALLVGDGGADHGAELSPAAAILAAAALGVDGICAGVGTDLEGMVLAWGRQTVADALEDLQFTLGQGPGTDAAAAGAPVLAPDLLQAAARWPAFVPGAMALKVRAVFAFPLRIGAINVGMLTAHRGAPGTLDEQQIADALALADAVALLLLDRASGVDGTTVPGAGGMRPGWAQPATYRAEVHQATGMISVQLEVSLADALVRLRAHAYAQERPIAEVAADVVARRLSFDDVSE